MEIIHINNINPQLEKFLFESRKLVLKTAFHGFSYRCYTKIINNLFQYITMVPNSGGNNGPVDFFTRLDNGIIKSYILIGSYMIEIPINEYKKMLEIIEKFLKLEGYLEIPSECLGELVKHYKQKIFSNSTIEKIDYLNYYSDMKFKNDVISDFNTKYYEYYQSIENARKARIEAALFAENATKIYIKG